MSTVKQALLAFSISVVVAVLMMQITKPTGFGQARWYEAQAHTPWNVGHVPEGYRPAIPWIAYGITRLTHASVPAAFFCLQIAFYGIILSMLWIWATRGLHLDPLVAACVCSLFVFSFAGTYNLHNRIHIGFAEHLFVLATFLLIYYDKFPALVAVVVVSCFVKESVGLVAIPTYFIAALTQERWQKVVWKTGVMGLLFVLTAWFIRQGCLYSEKPHVSNFTGYYLDPNYLNDQLRFMGGAWTGFVEAVCTYGPLWLLAGVGFLLADARTRALGTLQVAACLFPFVACDVARLVGLGFPVMLLLASIVLRRVPKHTAVILTSICAFWALCSNHGIGHWTVTLGSATVVMLLTLGTSGLMAARAKPVP
jgi:hypothetical protein